MENQEAYQRAKKRAEAKLGFYLHLAVYIVVNILLIIINLSTSAQYLWFKWPLIGWGIGVFFHALQNSWLLKACVIRLGYLDFYDFLNTLIY